MSTYVTQRSKRWKLQQYLHPARYSYPSSQWPPRFYPQSTTSPSPWRYSWEPWQWYYKSTLLTPCGSLGCQADICRRRCGAMSRTLGSSPATETHNMALIRAWLPLTGPLEKQKCEGRQLLLLTLLLATHHVFEKVDSDLLYMVENKSLAIRKGATHHNWGGRSPCRPIGSGTPPFWICTWPWTPWLWSWPWPVGLQTRCCFALYFVCSVLTF